jgi:hypothetical protein
MGYSVLQRMIINSAEILIIVVNFIFRVNQIRVRRLKYGFANHKPSINKNLKPYSKHLFYTKFYT